MAEPSTSLRRLATALEERTRQLGTVRRPAPSEPVAQAASVPGERRPAVRASDTEVERRLGEALVAAALSGRFSPDALFGPDDPEDLKRRVLSRLVADCEVQGGAGGHGWLLREGRRAATLRSLEAGIKAALGARLPATDAYGQALREILEHGAALRWKQGRHDPGEDRLLALVAAAESVESAGLPVPQTDALRAALGRATLLREHGALAAAGVVGRSGEIKALKAFVAAEPQSTGFRFEGLLLTGPGGAGKSTLLSRLVSEVTRSGSAVVAVLDFDRPGIDAGDPTFLEREITRQVGYQRPEIAGALRDLRRTLRAVERDGHQQQRQSQVDSSARRSRSILADMAALLAPRLQGGTILIVLDTFEIPLEQGRADKLIGWLDELAELLMPLSLKVIASGRMPGALSKADDGGREPQPVFNRQIEAVRRAFGDNRRLGDLHPRAAEQLLRNLGLPVDKARQLSRSTVLPRRPLELRLLGRLMLDDERIDVATLEAEIQAGSGRSDVLFAGIVYRRVLLRLRDTAAEALAHPGLVLRYVTPDLIQSVLVPALSLAPMPRGEAELALARLSSHDWLAFRARDGAVWHRRDLRRSMLPAMITEDPEKARRIHRTAVCVLGNSADERDRSEAFYHRLMLLRWDDEAWTEDLSLPIIRRASEAFHADVADLPPRGAALVRWAREGTASPTDVFLLPPILQDEALRRTGERLARAREYRNALELLAMRDVRFGTARTGRPVERWEAETLYASAAWPLLWRTERDSSNRKGDWPAVREIVGRLYPQALTARLGDVDWVSPMLEQLTVTPSPPKAEVARLLRELACTLVMVDHRSRLSNPARIALRRFLEALTEVGGVLTVDPRQALLARLARLPIADLPSRYGPDDFRIEREWLSLPRPDLGAALSRRISDAVADVQRSPRPTVSRLVAAVDAVAKSDWPRPGGSYAAVFDLRSAVSTEVRGPDDEYRDPARYALANAYPDERGLRMLADIVASCLEGDWVDLEPPAFAGRVGADPLKGLQVYIEAVDRSWNLGRLLQAASRQRPDFERLAMVAEAHSAWDRAVRGAHDGSDGIRLDRRTPRTEPSPARRVAETILVSTRLGRGTQMTTAVDLTKKAEFAAMQSLDLSYADIVAPQFERPSSEPISRPEKFAGRDGYDTEFLDGWPIPLPLPANSSDLVPLDDGSGFELKYRHFSTVMSRSRRMPILTACNINGNLSRSLPRISTWSFDGRVPRESQLGDALYVDNELDRGHMVRREDPVWGSLDEAKQANADTFHFTNSCPQMAGVNQVIWLGLENYILNHARQDAMRVSVFTGPYFTNDDIEYRGARVPLAFWKVVAIVTEDGRPSATAYKVSQEKELGQLEHVFGRYKTFQISVASVVADTGLRFEELVAYDGFSQFESVNTRLPKKEPLEDFTDIRI